MLDFFKSYERYRKVDAEGYIEFRNEEERMLFKKYLELGNKYGWTYVIKQTKGGMYSNSANEPYSAYDNVERIYVNIQGQKNCVGTAKREWDGGRYRGDFRCYIFDVLDNTEAVKYIFDIAEKYQDEQDKIKEVEEKAIADRQKLEKEHKEEVARIERYLNRINELNGSTGEFNEQFKILREIESLGELNNKILVSWKENIDKIHLLKKNFYNIN